MQYNCEKLQILHNIYEKINALMGLQQIFKVVFSELLPVVGGDSGVIQIVSSDKRMGYYGYHKKEGIKFWEPNDEYPCPVFINEIIDAVLNIPPEFKGKSSFYVSDMVYTELCNGDQRFGYFVIHRNLKTNHFFNEQILDYAKAVAGQAVSIINKKKAVEEKIDSEELSLLETVLSSLLHDMKNPLSGISGFIQLIEQKSPDDSINEYCGVILNSLIRIEKIINELIFIISGKTLKLDKSKISLPTLFKEIVNNSIEMYKHTSIDISVESDADIWVMADKDNLIKAFNNILNNAKEAMSEGGSLRIKLTQSDSIAKIEISDTGKGMPAYIQECVFKPFMTYGKENVTGLGMTIVQRVINAHGGNISVASFLGKGTVFTINLPIALKEA